MQPRKRPRPESSTLYALAQRRSAPVIDWEAQYTSLAGLTARELGRWARPLQASCLAGTADTLTGHRLDVAGFILCQREDSR